MVAIQEGSGNGNVERVVRAMLLPSFELDCESAALVLFIVEKAREEGYPLCPVAVAFATVLRRQLADLQPDSERCVDDGLEFDQEPEEDYDSILPHEANPSPGWVTMRMANGKIGKVRTNGKSNGVTRQTVKGRMYVYQEGGPLA